MTKITIFFKIIKLTYHWGQARVIGFVGLNAKKED